MDDDADANIAGFWVGHDVQVGCVHRRDQQQLDGIDNAAVVVECAGVKGNRFTAPRRLAKHDAVDRFIRRI